MSRGLNSLLAWGARSSGRLKLKEKWGEQDPFCFSSTGASCSSFFFSSQSFPLSFLTLARCSKVSQDLSEALPGSWPTCSQASSNPPH